MADFDPVKAARLLRETGTLHATDFQSADIPELGPEDELPVQPARIRGGLDPHEPLPDSLDVAELAQQLRDGLIYR
ncbi:hypothetical protein [Asanoa iriomotensis]|uniref:Uncharacterized protein n=1 Tax=Asanoa iriomotensis TaxID=234613 RepID=A0ABQ4CBS7_9ACTN|nr:hypothetical protein [Asanoa iriomotensis]GIF60227.1 hypothetical protein Air01nite_63220 [Asanoa iriomotensis]